MDLSELAARLAQRADRAADLAWPVESVRLLRDAGCLRNVIPRELGGVQASPVELVATYEHVARGDLSLALILTQHDRACELICDACPREYPRRVAEEVVRHNVLTTVGISQLTTSHRGGSAQMQARSEGDGFVLEGVMPWVSSAPAAAYIVTGAVLPDERQILACLPVKASGLTVGPPMALLALSSSMTCAVRCESVYCEPDWLLRGPAPSVLTQRAPVKPLTVSSVGIGMAGALIEAVNEYRYNLAQVDGLFDERIRCEYAELRERIYRQAEGLEPMDSSREDSGPADPGRSQPDASDSQSVAVQVRADVNTLIQRLALTLLTLIKGSGYLSDHPRQRLVREALFFLVWSAPDPVRAATLERIWGGSPLRG